MTAADTWPSGDWGTGGVGSQRESGTSKDASHGETGSRNGADTRRQDVEVVMRIHRLSNQWVEEMSHYQQWRQE